MPRTWIKLQLVLLKDTWHNKTWDLFFNPAVDTSREDKHFTKTWDFLKTSIVQRNEMKTWKFVIHTTFPYEYLAASNFSPAGFGDASSTIPCDQQNAVFNEPFKYICFWKKKKKHFWSLNFKFSFYLVFSQF